MVIKIPEKKCDICGKTFHLHEHKSGFVLKDEHFICKDHTDEEVKIFTKTVMQDRFNGMPIGLWLIHEQNKNKTMMTVKHRD